MTNAVSQSAVTFDGTYAASPASLTKATIWAGVAATAILTLFVLPAEWGIDPTGVGKSLGLTNMAANPEEDDRDSPEVAATPASSDIVVPDQTKLNIEARAAMRSDEKTLTLAPHTGVEIKAHMNKGDHLIFEWKSTGPIRQDMHGEPLGATNGEFTTYWKQKNMTDGKGSFTAPFDGTHGWYWRNGGETPVTITLKAYGFYKDLFEPAGE
ncbi:hypothetical protein [Novosphingobium album (ex Hu et al. 2023)]|uniref:Transmembrane anchor protein n=1 Tax=Novosphingobium album (ex Hu et al. 2023) TaxID=2930093 RepID=A0ABT0B7E1_9SPHN|nr:hypothetical protein [Novosphingobium album (ex Hu et al. 2023)]MCJ2180987.1 hypothetical protein [Novosphingobium album (ex Hu et al. 2023)]